MNDYSVRRIALALDLINTWDPFFPQPELLPGPADFVRFLAEHGFAPHADQAVGETELTEARALRAHLREVVGMADAGSAADALNSLLASGVVAPRMVVEGAGSGRLDLAVGPDASAIQRLRMEAALGLAEAITHYGIDRLRTCASPPCQEAFVDTSRNGARRFCCDRCANRYNVAAFRARRRSAAGEDPALRGYPVGAASDLAVEPLVGVAGPDLAPDLPGEGGDGEEVSPRRG